jgi:hypothetical protein
MPGPTLRIAQDGQVAKPEEQQAHQNPEDPPDRTAQFHIPRPLLGEADGEEAHPRRLPHQRPEGDEDAAPENQIEHADADGQSQ